MIPLSDSRILLCRKAIFQATVVDALAQTREIINIMTWARATEANDGEIWGPSFATTVAAIEVTLDE